MLVHICVGRLHQYSGLTLAFIGFVCTEALQSVAAVTALIFSNKRL